LEVCDEWDSEFLHHLQSQAAPESGCRSDGRHGYPILDVGWGRTDHDREWRHIPISHSMAGQKWQPQSTRRAELGTLPHLPLQRKSGAFQHFHGMGTDNKGNRIAFGSSTTDYGVMQGTYWAGRSAQQGSFTHI
jgi:hypothetical protein